MYPLPPYTTSPVVGGEPAVGGEPVVAGQPAVGGEPAIGGEPVVAGQPAGDASAFAAPDSTPHQGVGGEAARGWITIPPWDQEYSIQDVAVFRQSREWWNLMAWVTGCLAVTPGQTLSVHTTSIHLEANGLETV